MNFNFRMSFLLLLSMFVNPDIIFSDYTNSSNNNNTTATSELEKKFVSSYKFEDGYKKAVKFIKEHEGFVNKRYIDVAGIETIGYGHVVLGNEKFANTISEKKAELILKRDFEKAIRAVEEVTNLKGNKKIAIAHFVFMLGIGNFNKSNLKKLIDNNKPIDKELEKWCYYRSTSGKMIRSEHSYKIRQWEIKMYNK